jgi:hypothetical protein
MTLRPLRITRDDPNAWRVPAAGLVIAAAIVGIAILLGGTSARMLNGIGALLWIISGVFLALTLPPAPRQVIGWIVAFAGALALGGWIRPANLPEAVVGFAIAGAAVSLAAGDRGGGWALLVPTIYLPVHLLIGVGRAMIQGGGVRTDPPPTAAVLPVAMVLSAAIAGLLVATFLRREN